jgi:hypothetical protein
VASCAAFALLLFRVLFVLGQPASDPGDGNGGDGGRRRGSPRAPGPSGPDHGPVDWERFEREFRAYAMRHESIDRAAGA